jgi:hypothetical protein
MKKILLLLVLCPFLSYAQQDTNSKVKVYTPSSSTSKAQSNAYTWAVKTDFMTFLWGEFPLIGEYRITPKISLEGSVGMTYDFWGISDVLLDGNSLFGDYTTQAAMAGVYRLGAKYYPSSDYDAIEGFSFGLQLFNQNTNKTYEDATLSGKMYKRARTGILLTVGRQIFWNSNISSELFFGVGIANRVTTGYKREQNLATGFEYPSLQKEEKFTPNFLVGVRIGFGQ